MPPPKDLTLAGLIHDLNNVFQTLIEAADLLSTDPKWVGLSNTILRSVERGNGITGSLDESARSTDFETIVDRSIQFVEDVRSGGQTQQSHVTFLREIEPGLRFRGKALAMERVLVNLLVNGARAATLIGDPGELLIRAFQESGHLRIEVCDSGPGIDARILPVIFEPGFSTRTKATGLGLHIVRTIVEEHGGSVSAANREDRPGARFTIRIPVQAASTQSQSLTAVAGGA